MSIPDTTRRDFVFLASLGLLGGALAPLVGQSTGPRTRSLRRPVPETDAPLSVGLIEGSGAYSTFDILPWEADLAWDDPRFRQWWPEPPRVVPASELPIGDQGIVHTHVLLTVHGVYPDTEAWWRLGVERAELQVLFPSVDPTVPGPFPFLAWAYEGRPVPMPSQRLRFVVPIDGTGSLAMLLRVRRIVERGDGAEAAALAVQAQRHAGAFTADWQPQRPKLQRGVYLLGLRGDTWQQSQTLPEPGVPTRRDMSSLVVSVEPLGEELSRKLG